MKYKITHYANFGNYYVVVFEINGYYVYIICYKDETGAFVGHEVSTVFNKLSIIESRFNVVPYSEGQEYGELINSLVASAEKQLISKYPEIVDKINFYIEKEMNQLNML